MLMHPALIESLEPLRICDGALAAVIPYHPDYGLTKPTFVTTINQSFIPAPPFGKRRIVLRNDYLFGDDDYLQWPQPFSYTYPHHACIPSKQVDGPNSCMWTEPSQNISTQSDISIPNSRRLSR